MWSHFTAQFSITVFGLLWGYPFLVSGQGLDSRVAATLLIVAVACPLTSGPVLAWAVGRFPFYRSRIVLGIVGAMSAWWGLVLLWPGPAPLPVLVVLVCLTATGGPASMVGFDLARSFTPAEAIGRANGVVNIGGFVASLTTMALIGLLLDVTSGGGGYQSDFRVAMAAQYLIWGLGSVQILRYRRRAIAHLERYHPGAVAQMKRGETFVHPGLRDGEGL
jgi:hypothetical protein